MVNQTLVALVNSVLGTGKLTARGNAAYTCPFCKHTKPKLEINFDEESKSYESWHCWVCNKKGKKLHQMFKLIDVPSEKLVELKSIVKTYFAIDTPKQEEKIELPKEFKPLLEVAGFVQLGVQPAVFESRGISAKFVVLTTRLQCVVSSFSRQHARFNGRMAALDTTGIEVASFATNEGAAREHCFGQ